MAEPLTVPGYELLERLGGAGDAVVHRAREVDSGRVCALSLLVTAGSPPADAEERQLRFLEEGRLLLSLRHPNVVRTHDVGSGEGLCWIAQEHVDGPSLHDVLEASSGRVALEVALGVGVQVGRALAVLAEAQVVHGDVGTRSVLLDREGVARLGGFGLNFESSYERLSAGQPPVGGVDYLAPEQVEGDLPPTPRTDVYGLGATLYRALAGRVPHSGATLFTRLRSIARGGQPDLRELNPGLPDEAVELIDRMMEWDPDDRPLPQDVAALLEGVGQGAGLAEPGWERDAVRRAVEAQAALTSTPDALDAPLALRLRGTDRSIDLTLPVGGALEVGRSSDAAVSLPVGSVSRRHARFERAAEGVILRDLGSANGTLVNGQRVQGAVPVASGDRILFGKIQLELTLCDASEARPDLACTSCGKDLSDEAQADAAGACLHCQARAEVDREAAAARIEEALEQMAFEVTARVGGRGLFRRYRVRRRQRAFLASAIELGQRTAVRFAEESRPALALDHPTLLRALDLPVSTGILVVLQADHPGESLAERVEEQGPVAPGAVAALGAALCGGVAHLLDQGVRHVLVRPEQILVDAALAPKLVDVGLAPGLVEAIRSRSGPDPQPCFEAPEVRELRDVDRPALVYALGATLSYALTGTPVAEVRGGERYDLLPLTLVPTVPRPLAEVLARATAPQPAERFADPAALGAALRALGPALAAGRFEPPDFPSDEMTARIDLRDLPPGLLGR